jgi:hypothetical protein
VDVRLCKIFVLWVPRKTVQIIYRSIWLLEKSWSTGHRLTSINADRTVHTASITYRFTLSINGRTTICLDLDTPSKEKGLKRRFQNKTNTHLHLVRLFWNHVLTWASVIFRLFASAARSADAKYFCLWNRFSSSAICNRVNEVRGFFRLGGVRFWYGCPIRRVIGKAAETERRVRYVRIWCPERLHKKSTLRLRCRIE